VGNDLVAVLMDGDDGFIIMIIRNQHFFVYLCVEVCIMRHLFDFIHARRNTGHASGIF
jgi:hypothetical protein